MLTTTALVHAPISGWNQISASESGGNIDVWSTKPENSEQVRSFPHTKQVGAYLIGRTIGEGSFAKVKEGLHVLTREKVAVKVIDKRKARADRYVRRNMRREARLLQRVRHNNIVQLLDVMETENGFYLVMEYCGGGDLMTRICDSHVIDESDARIYVRQIVSAVDYLHRAGILHRDLKVENLLLDEKGKIKIIDFGLSNVVRRDSPVASSLTARSAAAAETGTDRISAPTLRDTIVDQTGASSGTGVPIELCTTQCGSPAYAAPELLSGAKYGPKVDVWSIGVNMFAMLTGNLPFTVEPFSVRELLNKMMSGQMNEMPSHLTKNCHDLLKRFLTANPERRISLYQAMHHPWLAEGRNKPMEPAPFPNRLTENAMCHPVLDYMVEQFGYQQSDVIRLVMDNVPSGATTTYHLLLRRMLANRHSSIPTSDSAAFLRQYYNEISAEKSPSTVQPGSVNSEAASRNINAKAPVKLLAVTNRAVVGDFLGKLLAESSPIEALGKRRNLPPLTHVQQLLQRPGDVENEKVQPIISDYIDNYRPAGGLSVDEERIQSQSTKGHEQLAQSRQTGYSEDNSVTTRSVMDTQKKVPPRNEEWYADGVTTMDFSDFSVMLTTKPRDRHATFIEGTLQTSFNNNDVIPTPTRDNKMIMMSSNISTEQHTDPYDVNANAQSQSVMHRYTINLDHQLRLPVTLNYNGDNTRTSNRLDSVVAPHMRLLGRRRLLQSVKQGGRTITRPPNDDFWAIPSSASNYAKNVNTGDQETQHPVTLRMLSEPLPSERPLRPSACHIVDLSFKGGTRRLPQTHPDMPQFNQ